MLLSPLASGLVQRLTRRTLPLMKSLAVVETDSGTLSMAAAAAAAAYQGLDADAAATKGASYNGREREEGGDLGTRPRRSRFGFGFGFLLVKLSSVRAVESSSEKLNNKRTNEDVMGSKGVALGFEKKK